MAVEGSAASVVSQWELLAGSFPAWFLTGCQALFDMWPMERGLFCLVARPIPRGMNKCHRHFSGTLCWLLSTWN